MSFWSQKRLERGNFHFLVPLLTPVDQYIPLLTKVPKTPKWEKDMLLRKNVARTLEGMLDKMEIKCVVQVLGVTYATKTTKKTAFAISLFAMEERYTI